MARTAYIGSTIFVTDKKFLFSYIGQNGDTAFVVNPNTKKVLAEFTKYDREWVSVNMGDSSGTVLDLDELESVVTALQNNVDVVISNLNSFRTSINQKIDKIEQDIESINTNMENLNIDELSETNNRVDALTTKVNVNILNIAELTEQSSAAKSAIENIQDAYLKNVEIDTNTGQLVFTKQDNNTVSVDLASGGAGTLTTEDLNQMWDS